MHNSSISVSKRLDEVSSEKFDCFLFSKILLFVKKNTDEEYTLKGSILVTEHLLRVSHSDKGEITLLIRLSAVIFIVIAANMLNLILSTTELPHFSLAFSSAAEVELWEMKLQQLIDENKNGTN